jgi:hypothetical protein
VTPSAEAGLTEALRGLRPLLPREGGLAELLERALAPFDAPAPDATARWAAQACALREWESLERELARLAPARPRTVSDNREALAKECEEVIQRIQGRASGIWFASLLLSPVAQDTKLFEELEALLKKCCVSLRQEDAPADNSGLDWEQINRWRTEASARLSELRQARPAWPPTVLLGLVATGAVELGGLGQAARPGVGAHLQGEQRDRAVLACQVFAVVPAASFAAGHLPVIHEAMKALLGDAAAVELLLKPQTYHDPHWRVNTEQDCAEGKLVRPGLLLKWAGSAKPECPVPGVWVVPPKDLHPVLANLRLLSSPLSKVPGVDPSLPRLCEEVERLWPQKGDITGWWKSAPPQTRQKVWELAQRLHLLCADHPEQQGKAAGLLQALRGAQFYLEPASEALKQKASESGDWLVYTSKPPGQRKSFGVGPVLVGPDGTQVAPALWLRLLPEPVSRPFAECLEWVGLLLRLPPFAEDEDFRHLFAPVMSGAQNGSERDAERCRQLFQEVYAACQKQRADARGAYIEVALRLHRCLSGMGQALHPELDGHLRPRLGGLPADTEFEPVCEGDGQLGEAWVLRFGDEERPPRLAVRVSPEVALWLNLPSPPANDLGNPLRQWQEQVVEVLASPTSFAQARARAAQWFRGQLNTEKGEKWFHKLAKTASANTPETAWALAWLNALIEEKFCEGCFPLPTTSGTIWPTGVPLPLGQGVAARPDPKPRGSVVHVVNFAERPEKTKCVMSLGPEDEWPVAAHLAQLEKLTKSKAPVAHDALKRLHGLLRKDRLLGNGPSAAHREAFEQALDGLEKAGLALEGFGPILKPLAAAATELGALLWPASLAEARPLDRGPVPTWDFSAQPQNEAISFRFAVQWKEGGERRGALVLSSGHAPEGYDELRALLDGGAGPVQALAATLRAIATAGPEEARSAACRAFEEFHVRSGAKQALGTEKGEEATTALYRLVRSLGLEVLRPEAGGPCQPNWRLEDEHGNEVNEQNCRVGRVRCPGLKDGDHLMLAPAIIVSGGAR